MLFGIQRGDARVFRPHREADLAFARELETSARAGVAVMAVDCRVDPGGVELRGCIPVADSEGTVVMEPEGPYS